MRRAAAFIRLHANLVRALLKRRDRGFAAVEEVHSRPPGVRALTEEEVIRWAGAWLYALSRMGWKPGCLRRSLLLAEVLRREGYEARVVLGVAREGDSFRGHSWVELGGRALGAGSGGFTAVWMAEPGGGNGKEPQAGRGAGDAGAA